MKIPSLLHPALFTAALGAALLATGARRAVAMGPPPAIKAAAPQNPAVDEAASRELYGLAEEQALLARQIQRLRQTMDVLAGRLEAEGRTRAVTLLREGLAVLDQRGAGELAMTLDERMESVREELASGQWMQSLEHQEAIIADLESLLEVLLDRQDLDKLEERIEELAAAKADLAGLAGREAELRRETEQAAQEAIERELGDWNAKLDELKGEQAAALTSAERAARESGALERERIARSIGELAQREAQLAELLGAWSSGELDAQKEALGALEEAARAAREADGKRAAEEALGEAAEALTDGAAPEEVAKDLERALGGRSEASARKAHEEARAALGELASGGDRAGASAKLEAQAEAAGEAAAGDEAMARAAAEAARGALKEAAVVPKDLEQSLGTESPEGGLSGALERALEELKQSAADSAFLPEAAAGAQGENLRTTGDLKASLERLAEESPAGEEGALEEALAQLASAMEAMAASQESASKMGTDAAAAGVASAQAAQAKASLEAALEALAAAAQAAAQSSGASAQAQAQAQLGEQASQLSDELEASSASDPSAATAALERAAEAMAKAAEALSMGQTGEATEAQREALDALDEAGREAKAGVRPEATTSEALAEKQKRIEDDLLKLATRLEEEERPEAADAVQSAAREAQDASEALGGGDMSKGQEAERRVEEELDKAKAELEAEEEKYQQLRREEILIQLTEELQALYEGHQAQLAEVKEIDAARAGRETPSRAQKLRLRRVAREETTLSEKAAELTGLLNEEGSAVFASAMDEVRIDLERAARELGSPGESATGAGFDSGWRTQAVMADAERLLRWLLDALTEEAQRRRDEAQKPKPQGGEGQDPGGEGENRLVPSQAELRLLRSMELDVQRSIEQTTEAYPELANTAPEDVAPLILEDLMRLAGRHNRVTELFRAVAQKLGVPGIGGDQ